MMYRRQALMSTRFKSDGIFYKKVDIFVRVYKNFINGSGTRSGGDGGDTENIRSDDTV